MDYLVKNAASPAHEHCRMSKFLSESYKCHVKPPNYGWTQKVIEMRGYKLFTCVFVGLVIRNLTSLN